MVRIYFYRNQSHSHANDSASSHKKVIVAGIMKAIQTPTNLWTLKLLSIFVVKHPDIDFTGLCGLFLRCVAHRWLDFRMVPLVGCDL